MKNDCICLERTARNEFRAEASFQLFGLKFCDVDVKIDTGCGYTTIPVQRIGLSCDEAYALKLADTQDTTVRKQISFGVNDSREKKIHDKALYDEKKYMELTSVTFAHSLEQLSIGGVSLDAQEVKISYDRVGNVLIGLDILEQLDIHIGESRINGKHMLIACPKNKRTDGYCKMLEQHFGLKNE